MQVKLGIIGYGGMGKWHGENAPRADVEIAAVCDILEERRKEAGKHVIAEKPAAMNVQELDEMEAA